MAPRKPSSVTSLGIDPRTVRDNLTSYLGALSIQEAEIADLVAKGVLVQGQGIAPGTTVVQQPGEYGALSSVLYLDAGLRSPCDDLLPYILQRIRLELPQLNPTMLVHIATFGWMC